VQINFILISQVVAWLQLPTLYGGPENTDYQGTYHKYFTLAYRISGFFSREANFAMFFQIFFSSI
jgi:hypothetical protein